MDEKKLQNHISTSSTLLSQNFYLKSPQINHMTTHPLAYSILNAQDDAWNLYAGAITRFISGGATWSNLQLVGQANLEEKIMWDDSDFGDFYFHKITSDLINGVGATYNKTDKSYSLRYVDFVRDINRPAIAPNAQSKMIEADIALSNDEKRHKELENNLNLEWQSFDMRQKNSLPPNLWIKFEDWWKDNALDKVARSQEINLSYFMNYEYWVQQTFGGGELLAETLLKCRDPRKQIAVNLPQNARSSSYGGKKLIYPYQISEDYSRWLISAKSGQLARTTINIQHDSERRDVSQSNIAGGAGVFFGFFGAIGGGQRRTLQIDTQSEHFKLSFDAIFKTFTILPGDWCDTNIFDLYRNGPFYPNSNMERLRATNALFGSRGYLSFRPIRAIVAYNPKLSITLDRDSYHFFNQETSGFVAFCIGPFVIGGGAYYDKKTTVSNDADKFTFGFEIKDYAILVAFDSQDI